MVRQKVTLRLNAGVIQKAKKAEMNLSYFLEVKLVEHLALLNGTPRRRFELGFTSKKAIESVYAVELRVEEDNLKRKGERFDRLTKD